MSKHTEGAEIIFRCNPGFAPARRMTAVCEEDGRWDPDPAGHRCKCKVMYELSFTTPCKFTPLVSRRTPSFSDRVDVESLSNNTVSSEIAYQCQSDLLPEGR